MTAVKGKPGGRDESLPDQAAPSPGKRSTPRMTFIALHCPHGHSEPIVKRGTTRRGKPRYLCQHSAWTPGSFRLAYRTRGGLPGVKQPLMERSCNARGMRDTARVLRSSTDPVRRELRKKATALELVNAALLRTLTPNEVSMDSARAGAAEMEARGSLGGKKTAQRWRWPALDSATGAVLASVCGRHKAAVLLQWKALREPCGLPRFSTDHWGAYTRHLDPSVCYPTPSCAACLGCATPLYALLRCAPAGLLRRAGCA